MAEEKEIIELVDIEAGGEIIDLVELADGEKNHEDVIELTDLVRDEGEVNGPAEEVLEKKAGDTAEDLHESSRSLRGELSVESGVSRGSGPDQLLGKIEVSQEMLEKAVEKVVQKMFYQKIDKLLVDVIGKTVSHDIELLKKVVQKQSEAGKD